MKRSQLQAFAAGVAGEALATPVDTSVASVLPDSSPGTPIVLIVSPGTDPASEIQQLAKTRGRRSAAAAATRGAAACCGVKVTLISLGRGQSAAAEAAIDEGAEKGHWVRPSVNQHIANLVHASPGSLQPTYPPSHDAVSTLAEVHISAIPLMKILTGLAFGKTIACPCAGHLVPCTTCTATPHPHDHTPSAVHHTHPTSVPNITPRHKSVLCTVSLKTSDNVYLLR